MNIKELIEKVKSGEIALGDKVYATCYDFWSSWNSGMTHLRDIPPTLVAIKLSSEHKGYPRRWGCFYFNKIGKKGQELKAFIQEHNGMNDAKTHVFLTLEEADAFYKQEKANIKIETRVYQTVDVSYKRI